MEFIYFAFACFLFGVAVFIFLSVLIVLNAKNTAENNPCDKTALLVLGFLTVENRPTPILAKRLDAAFDYLLQNGNTVCIVSGGKGRHETQTEASVMEQYLVLKGIPPDRIIKEDKSVRTSENIKYCVKLLDLHKLSKNVIVVTSDFHMYRGLWFAKKYGLNAKALIASTPAKYVVYNWIREIIAILKAFILRF